VSKSGHLLVIMPEIMSDTAEYIGESIRIRKIHSIAATFERDLCSYPIL